MRLSAVKIIRKTWSKSFNTRIVYNRVGFRCICATISRQNTELFCKLFTRATESGRSMGGCNFGNIVPINAEKIVEIFDEKLSKSSDFYYLEPGLYPSITDIAEAMNTLIEESAIKTKTLSQLRCFEERKNLTFTLKKKDLVLHSLIRTLDKFSYKMLPKNLE